MRVFAETVVGIIAMALAVAVISYVVENKHARERAAEMARK